VRISWITGEIIKKQRFREEQIVGMLRQAEVRDRHRVSGQTWYRCRRQFGQMEVPGVPAMGEGVPNSVEDRWLLQSAILLSRIG